MRQILSCLALRSTFWHVLLISLDVISIDFVESLVAVILTAEDLQQLIGSFLPSQMDYVLWQPSWIARYSVLIKCRGVIKSKGYMMRAARDIKQRPYKLSLLPAAESTESP